MKVSLGLTRFFAGFAGTGTDHPVQQIGADQGAQSLAEDDQRSIQGDYGFSTAVGLFNTVINIVLLISMNSIVKKLNDGKGI